MEYSDFKEYLQDRSLEADKIDIAVRIIKEFEKYLSKLEKLIKHLTYEDFHSFSAFLIENKRNTFDNYVSLLRFGYFTNNDQLIIASMEILDGREMIENFSNRLIEEFGETFRDEIFEGIEIPPLGLHPKEKPKVTKKLIERLVSRVDQEKCTEFLAYGLRDKYTESYKKPREEYLKSKDIDEFLIKKRQNFIQSLETHLKEATLFFTQKIDEAVIEHIKNDKTIESGVREGDRVIITKIPYDTIPYLNATDERKRKYYFCHCPWVREALLEEDQPIDPIFCHMSGGFYKNYWEAVLDRPVKVELLESVMMGDVVCKFALHLPEDLGP